MIIITIYFNQLYIFVLLTIGHASWPLLSINYFTMIIMRHLLMYRYDKIAFKHLLCVYIFLLFRANIPEGA